MDRRKDGWLVQPVGWGILKVLEGSRRQVHSTLWFPRPIWGLPPLFPTWLQHRDGHRWPFPVLCTHLNRKGICYENSEDTTGSQGGLEDQVGRFCSLKQPPKSHHKTGLVGPPPAGRLSAGMQPPGWESGRSCQPHTQGCQIKHRRPSPIGVADKQRIIF